MNSYVGEYYPAKYHFRDNQKNTAGQPLLGNEHCTEYWGAMATQINVKCAASACGEGGDSLKKCTACKLVNSLSSSQSTARVPLSSRVSICSEFATLTCLFLLKILTNILMTGLGISGSWHPLQWLAMWRRPLASTMQVSYTYFSLACCDIPPCQQPGSE